MELKGGELKIEVLEDKSDADSTRMAKRRERLCVMSPSEQERFAYGPNEAHLNDNPAYPAEADYGGFNAD